MPESLSGSVVGWWSYTCTRVYAVYACACHSVKCPVTMVEGSGIVTAIYLSLALR